MMFAIFNFFRKLPMIFIIGGIITILGLFSAFGIHYIGIVNDRAALITKTEILESQVESLEEGLEEQKKVIDQQIRDQNLADRLRDQIFTENTQLRDRERRLIDRLSQHELGALAASRPGLVGPRINKGTADAFRCLEILSGSPLTMNEINAILPSELNTTCPDLANPNRRDQ